MGVAKYANSKQPAPLGAYNMKFKNIIIWGHPLHSHTHSYIHNAFYRAFLHMGYNTCWFDDMSDVSGFDFTDSLFLTEGQVCAKMPIIKGCTYILHNCYDADMWATIHEQQINHLKLQVYTDDVLNHAAADPANVKMLEPCIYHDAVGRMLYMPWATDLMPHEISLDIRTEHTNAVWWVGSMGEGQFGNMNELNGFMAACKDNGIEFKHANNLSIEENRQKIAESYMSPAIVGTWQREKGYVPCRIFKNISYSQFGITNSARVQELFENRLVYSDNEYDLFEKTMERRNQPNHQPELTELIEHVRDRHTYINRINTLLSLV